MKGLCKHKDKKEVYFGGVGGGGGKNGPAQSFPSPNFRIFR